MLTVSMEAFSLHAHLCRPRPLSDSVGRCVPARLGGRGPLLSGLSLGDLVKSNSLPSGNEFHLALNLWVHSVPEVAPVP